MVQYIKALSKKGEIHIRMEEHMRVLGNILWFIFGGLAMGLAFALEGLACFLTLIGIPFGLQWFKMVPLVFVPFGKGIRYPKVTGMKVFGNVLWVILVGWWNALACLLWGVLCCITIIGIPFGKQWFKLARLLFLPFGAEVYNEVEEKKEQQRQERMVTNAAVAAATAVAAQNNAYANNGAFPAANYSLPASQPAIAVGKSKNWVCPSCGKPDNPAKKRFCECCGKKSPKQEVYDFEKNNLIVAVVLSAAAAILGLLTCVISRYLFLLLLMDIIPIIQIILGVVDIKKRFHASLIMSVYAIGQVFVSLSFMSFAGILEIVFGVFELGVAVIGIVSHIKRKKMMEAAKQHYYTTSAEETPEQNTAYTPSEAPIIENNTWTCPNCGKTDNPTDCAFCGGCGQKRVVENKSWACPSCGKTDNPTECNFCGNCGAKRPPQPIS